MEELIYRKDIYEPLKEELDELFEHNEISNLAKAIILNLVAKASSSFWNPCTNEENVPQKGQEVLVSLEYPNGKKEIAFGEHCGENRNGDLAYWGGQNELVKAWARVPDFYEEDNMEQKYSYRLDGKLYFICLTPEEKLLFENRYNVFLSLVD